MKSVTLGENIRRAGQRTLVALVDDEDYEVVSPYRWHVKEECYPDGTVARLYARTSVQRDDGTYADIFMHKLITGWERTDHRDHDGLNNQRCNLRPASIAQNNHNQRPRKEHSSRFKGVTWHRQCKKWQAAIKIGGKNNYLGLFISEDDAADAYDAAALKAYGEYAYLNRVHAA